MTPRRARLPRLAVPLAALVGAALISGPGLPAALGSTPTAVQTDDIPDNLDPSKTEAFSSAVNGLEDVDTRAAAVAPGPVQKQLANKLNATVRWNRYGTPSSILPNDGLLAGRNGSAVKTAKSWLAKNAALFGGAKVISSLELVNDQKMTRGSTGHAVLFRQQFGDLTSAVEGLVTVGVNDRGVVYVSSSLSKATASLSEAAAELSAQDAWLAAAKDVGITDKTAADIGSLTLREGFTEFGVDGLAQQQQVRLRAVAMSNSSVRPVYETNVVDVQGGKAVAYTSYVDAVSGKVLVRRNQVDNLSTMPMTESVEPFAGAITPTECGPAHGAYTVDNQTKTISVGVNALLPDTDIVIKLYKDQPSGQPVASQDLLFSPEVLIYSPDGGVPAGDYFVVVCPFEVGQAQESGEYIGVFASTNQQLDAPDKAQPAWKHFPANPSLDFSTEKGAGPRATMCWVKFNVAEDIGPCPARYRLNNLAARLPWDTDPNTFLPTFTTTGNAAETREAWLSPLTPGGANQRPLQPDRTYNDEFTDAWNNTKCSNDAFLPHNNNNDILAATTNLFAGHNRFHDFSYYLGFTEDNYNLQRSNFGNLGAEGDPEVGNVQAGALTGGQPSFLGRDNANQITLQDGIPGITNQYLFQPIEAAFYAPCTDGDLDATVFGHEYTHAITNRMVAGPDEGLSGFQAGSMGESWSDLVALEYTFSHDYDLGAGANQWALGPYVTGNLETGIRNYALNKNPLQYGDVGYDSPGAEVHSDGEIWNAVMWDVRQALVKKYNAEFPYTNKRLQIRCAEGFRGTRSPHGPLPPYKCPGNNRWIALMFDSYLLQQSGTSMLDARDAFLAADLLRFHGKNNKTIWDAFASDGFGNDASTEGTDDDQPIPGYSSPQSREGTLRIKALSGGRSVTGDLLVSKYDARVTPVADTSPKTKLGSSVKMVSGTYSLLFRAPGYGLTAFKASVKSGDTTVKTLRLDKNLASKFSGAKIAGTTGAGDTAASRNPDALIDDTQGSNWGVMTEENVDQSKPVINVDLAGGAHVVRSVNVSAFLRPAGGDTSDEDSGSRFTALRQFAIEVCTARSAGDCTGTGSEGYQRIYTSSPKAFNSVLPRPLAPTLVMKSFHVPDTKATHVRLVVLHNQCTGQADFRGDQDNDLLNPTDCRDSDRATIAHAAELQVFE